MDKIDLKKKLKHLYASKKEQFTIVDVPRMNFLMIDGKGDPNTSQAFKDAVEALYSVSYAIKFESKKIEIDYVVMPLEGLWFTDNMMEFSLENKGKWQWTLMIMQPDHITEEMVSKAIDTVREKKNPVALDKIRFEGFSEGVAAQVTYVGSYIDEAPTIEKLHGFIEDNGYEKTGQHHEIYLSEPRRVVPEKLKTIIRQPIKKI